MPIVSKKERKYSKSPKPPKLGDTMDIEPIDINLEPYIGIDRPPLDYKTQLINKIDDVSDLDFIPDMTGNAGQTIIVNSTEDGFDFVQGVDTTDSVTFAGITSTGNLDVDGNTTLDDLTVDGPVDINGNADISGTTTMGGDLTVNADIDLNGDIDVSGSATLNGAVYKNRTTVSTATYTLATSDYMLHVTRTSTGTCTITLPTAQTTDKRFIHVKDAGGNAATYNITIDTEGSETIDGDATCVISDDYNAVSLYSDGSNWFIY